MRLKGNLNFYFIFFQYVYEDSMDLIAKLPTVAATIYRNLYRDGSSIGAIDVKKFSRKLRE